MEDPVSVGGSGEYDDFAKKQKMEEDKSAAHPINVNGHSLKMGDLYSSHYDRKEMIGKLTLLDKGAKKGAGQGTEVPDKMKNTQGGVRTDNSPGEDDTEEDRDEPGEVEDQLFGGAKPGKSQAP